MSDHGFNRQQLIIINKLLLYTLLLFFIYIFFSGLLSSTTENEKSTFSNQINISNIEPGDYRITSYRNNMILILHRDADMLAQLHKPVTQLHDPESKQSQQAAHSENLYRSQYPQYLIVNAYDPDSNCQLVIDKQGKTGGGIRDLCSGNHYDWAGRAIKPARINLTVPDYDLTPQLSDDSSNQSLP